MRAVVLVGDGSVLPGIGTAMIRIAARIRDAGIAPIAVAGFLHGCRPTFWEAIESCFALGATEIMIQPYTLVEEQTVRRDLRRTVLAMREQYPKIPMRVARPLGDHVATAQIALQRAMEADYAYAHGMERLPQLIVHQQHVDRPAPQRYHTVDAAQQLWQPLYTTHSVGLVLVVQGASSHGWNWPIRAAAEWLRTHSRYQQIGIGYLDSEEPDLEMMLVQFAARQFEYVLVVPFMLQLTHEQADGLAAATQAAQQKQARTTFLLTEHLNYDRRLVTAVGDRVAEALERRPRRA